MSNDGSHSLDALVHHITSTNNYSALNHTLRNSLPKDARESILAGPLSNGQDPLNVLDVKSNTLGVLYIMSARLHSLTSPPPHFFVIQEFCRHFSPEQARYAPERVTFLAKGIVQLAEGINSLKSAVQPLLDLLTRYPYNLSYLTTLHPIFVLVCVQTQHFSSSLPILNRPITQIDTGHLSLDLTYADNLVYHYAGGIALAALKRWEAAAGFFEICVSSPGVVPSAIQLEAYKKLVLVQLISAGKTTPPPKYTHPLLTRIFKSTPYNAFSHSYPRQMDYLRNLMEKERPLFTSDKNIGLMTQALERAPRWAIKKLTATYLTLGLGDIGRAVSIENEEEVRSIIMSMIESSEISAQISIDGTVTFSDPPHEVSKADVDRMLRHAQDQSALLSRLEMEMGRNRDYLSKAMKSNRDEGAWGASADEEMMLAPGSTGSWAEEMFL